MPLYEHVFLGRQDISAQQFEGLVESFQTVIKENGGSVEKSEYWGIKNLTFKIRKNRKAHYALLNLDAPPEAVQEMERQMRLSSDVVRFLTLRVDAHDPNPSPMMKRGDRDDRRGGRRDRDGGPRETRRRDRDDDKGKPDKETAKAESGEETGKTAADKAKSETTDGGDAETSKKE